MKHLFLIACLGVSAGAMAETPTQILDQLQSEAGQSGSVARGKLLYHGKFGGQKADSCAACHTANARDAGAHLRTHKRIEPLAPSANPERFTDRAKVEKWFKRNCNEVLNRACTPQEKADFAAYVLAQ